MARTVAQIYTDMVSNVQGNATLAGLQPLPDNLNSVLAALTSRSKVAIWRLMLFVVAVGMWVLENLYDQHVAEVTALAALQKFGSLPWYVKIALEYQDGDTLVFVDDFPVYDPVDPSARIVTQAAANEASGIVQIKVAKTVSGALAPLSSQELTNFTAYMNQRKPAGIPINCTSLNPDRIALAAVVDFDGVLNPTIVLANIEAAISAYVTGLPFDGRFRVINLVDAIQAVQGVVDVRVIAVTAYVGAVSQTVSQNYITTAGYAVFDSSLSSINLIPV